jgi:hypothetical protein
MGWNMDSKRFPLLFGFEERIIVHDFVAHVKISGGRALASQESDGTWWLDGVNPGAMCESGQTLSEAVTRFCHGIRLVLADMTADQASFEDFKRAVERFFSETDSDADAWEEARRSVRKGLLDIPGLKKDTGPARSEIVVTSLPMESVCHGRETIDVPSRLAA